MSKKVQLECVRTYGRWNKGDRAGFEAETAEKMVKAKNAAWREVGQGDGENVEPVGGDPDGGKPVGKKAAAVG